MLDKDTKQTIDNARDILVGKVPNPVTQIDLITTAMIYKFMDDMDLENISLGGKRVFFVGDLEQYAWSKLLSATVGNSERINLYTEALDKLPYAKQIPQLFRSIFKDAFLPFRDGATLTLFLKEIDSLSYDNSENLGDGFEYLLSVMGSQGDAGQFRTPRHIIDFIVEVVNPTKNDAILDPACGTAGFLISAYKHIIKTANEQKKPLSVDAIKQIAQNITGYDIDPTMQKLSLVNLYLHKFATPKVYEYDTLTKEDRWGDKFDVILANPPFMTPKGGIRPHNKFGIKANKSEVLFVDYFMEHLTLNGRAGFVVPEGIVFKNDTAYKNLRKMMVEDNYLYAVVSLPKGVFNPYSPIKTYILFFDRQLAKKTDKILFVEVKNDGFDLGAQRRAIKENDLPSALQAIQEYQKSYNNADLKLPDNCLLVEKSKIAENGDYNLTASRYRQTAQVINSKWEMVKLGDVCELYQPKTITQKDLLSDGLYEVYGANGIIGRYNEYNHENPEVVITCRGATCGTVNITKARCWITGNAMVASPKENILSKSFLYYVLRNTDMSSVISGAAQPQITRQSLKELQIPLPPLEVQQEIVKELDGYQAIINGSQDVIDNWKPYFAIKPNWPKVKLSEVCEINPKKSRIMGLSMDKEVSFVPMECLNIRQKDFREKETRKLSDVFTKYTYFEDNDVLLAKVTPCFENGKSGIANHLKNNIGFGSSEFYVLRCNEKKILKEILYYIISNPQFIEEGKHHMTGTGGLQRLEKDYLANYVISLPSLTEQKAIVDKIAFEEQYINTCKEYVAHFKQKIADKIQTIWSSK